MSNISTEKIKFAIEKLCYDACTSLNAEVYDEIKSAFEISRGEEKLFLKNILLNAQIAETTGKALCQDTGQVIVFLDIGQNVKLSGEYIEDAVNSGVKNAYLNAFLRKSVVRDAVFDRANTQTNTPCIIYMKIIPGDDINLSVLIKGAGSENKSKLEMMLPGADEDEIISKCAELILQAGENSCPPMFIGISAGGTADKAVVTSKEVFVSDNFSEKEKRFADKIKSEVNKQTSSILKNSYVLDVKFKSLPTHIACLPVAITINCHSDRYSKCLINENETLFYHKEPDFIYLTGSESSLKRVNIDDINTLKKIPSGENFLLSGELYVARDAAHKRISKLIKHGEKLPFDLKNKIIFYAGPCPAKPGEVSGSIGPTTSSRMDVFVEDFYSAGVFATIGKGTRSKEAENSIIKYGGRYFTAQGGIAALLSQKIKKSEIIAYEDLGAEAIYKIEVKDFPVCAVI